MHDSSTHGVHGVSTEIPHPAALPCDPCNVQAARVAHANEASTVVWGNMYQPQQQAKAPPKASRTQERIFCFGERVQYLSRSTGQWIPAIVQGHAMVPVPGGASDEFHYHLDVQEAAHPSRVKAADTQVTQVAQLPPKAKPKLQSEHPQPQPCAQPQPQAQPAPVTLPPPASAPAPLHPLPPTAANPPKPAGRWQLMCLHSEGFSQEVLQALPSALRAVTLPDGKSHLGRQHQAKFLEALLAKSPQFLSIISRTHADVEAPRDSSKIRITNLTQNPIFVNSTALWQGQSNELGPGATLSFARNQGDDTPHHFLILQLQALDSTLLRNEAKAKAEATAEAGPASAAIPALVSPLTLAPPSSGPAAQPPSPSAMTTVDVAKVGIPTEVLQHLRAVETCKLDSPKVTASAAPQGKPDGKPAVPADIRPAPKPDPEPEPPEPRLPDPQMAPHGQVQPTPGSMAVSADGAARIEASTAEMAAKW